MMAKQSKLRARRGAPKGHIGNPTGKNQHNCELSINPVTSRLYKEDYDCLLAIAEGNEKGFVAKFVRDAVRAALAAVPAKGTGQEE